MRHTKEKNILSLTPTSKSLAISLIEEHHDCFPTKDNHKKGTDISVNNKQRQVTGTSGNALPDYNIQFLTYLTTYVINMIVPTFKSDCQGI